MGTPFLQFSNARLRFKRRTSRIPNFRDGGRVPEEDVVIEAFTKLVFSAAQGFQQTGGAEFKQQFLSGYITRYAVIPNGADWLDAGTNWTWDESGLKPDGLDSGHKLDTWIGNLKNLPSTDGGERGLTDMRSVILPYGTGGIGEIIRGTAGDRIDGVYAFVA